MRAMGAMPGVRVIGVAVGITVKRGDSMGRVSSGGVVQAHSSTRADNTRGA